MDYTYLHNLISNSAQSAQPSGNTGVNLHWDKKTKMKPTLGYLTLARDVITDASSKEISLIRIFDTLFIPKGDASLIYSFYIVGRLYLNTTGIFPTVSVKLKISDPSGTEIRTEHLNATNINAEIGISLNALILLAKFETGGKYSINLSVSTDGKSFVELNAPVYFQVQKVV